MTPDERRDRERRRKERVAKFEQEWTWMRRDLRQMKQRRREAYGNFDSTARKLVRFGWKLTIFVTVPLLVGTLLHWSLGLGALVIAIYIHNRA